MSEPQDDCWQCKERKEKGYNGHFHCDRCGASITHGEDPWYWDGDIGDPNQKKICNACKVKESYG